MQDLKKINIPTNKLLQKYGAQFTKEGKDKMTEVYLLTTSFVCYILNDISNSKPIGEEACAELLKTLGFE